MTGELPYKYVKHNNDQKANRDGYGDWGWWLGGGVYVHVCIIHLQG